MRTIAKIIVGSRLYGTQTPTSDTDYLMVGVFSPADIVLGKAQNSQNKNGLDDKKIFDLKSFFEHLAAGQTWAIETLFAPADCITQCTPLWNLIVRNRNMFISKDVAPFVGFASGQARKYSDKGFRLQSIQAATQFLQKWGFHTTLDEMRPELEKFTASLPEDLKANVEFRKVGDRTCDEYWSVCGRDFQMTQQVKVVYPSLEKMEKEFGARSRQASAANGKDWKALSHAIRVAIEANEVLMTGKISFPLQTASYVREVKQGLRPQAEVDNILENLIKNVEVAKGLSTLPVKANRVAINKLLSDILITAVVDHDRFGQDWLYPVRGVIE